MKKLTTSVLSVLVLLVLALPTTVFWVLKGAYWFAEKSVAAIERLRLTLLLPYPSGRVLFSDIIMTERN